MKIVLILGSILLVVIIIVGFILWGMAIAFGEPKMPPRETDEK